MRSVEVMRLRFDSCMRQRRKARGLHVNHAILILEGAFDEKKLAARHYQAVLFINIRRHDDIRDSRLIFHGDKNETLRGPWALARDDAAGRAHKHAVAAVAQVF